MLNAAIDAAADAGVIMCVAAGTRGLTRPTSRLPRLRKPFAWQPWPIPTALKEATASDLPAGPDDTMADLDRAPVVDRIAPGVDILSCWPASLGMSYNNISGTSMACPHVAGLMALFTRAGQLRLTGYANTTIPVVPGINGPALIQEFIKAGATESVPGILGDTLTYPMINIRPSN